MQTDRERNLLSWGIVFGAIVGSLAAFFFAPQKGDETKKKIAKNLNRFTQTSILKTQNVLLQFEGAMEKSISKDENIV